jgi:hypothetical protein
VVISGVWDSVRDKTASNFKFGSWVYDTLQIGKPTSCVTGGYTVAFTGYSAMGNPLGQTITLPGVERPLPTSYTTKYTYTPNTEKLSTQEDPAVAGLPGETITYGHNLLGSPTRTSGIDLYVADTIYTDFGQPSKMTMGDSTNEVQSLYTYDEYTLRLSSRSIYRNHGIGPLIDQSSYTYDDSGNPLSAVNKQSETGNTVTDAQCYRYDSLARLDRGHRLPQRRHRPARGGRRVRGSRRLLADLRLQRDRQPHPAGRPCRFGRRDHQLRQRLHHRLQQHRCAAAHPDRDQGRWRPHQVRLRRRGPPAHPHRDQR